MEIMDLCIKTQLVAGFFALLAVVVEMNGIGAFKTILNNSHLEYIPAIALTTNALKCHREIIPVHGFGAYKPKPIDNKVFLEILKVILYGK